MHAKNTSPYLSDKDVRKDNLKSFLWLSAMLLGAVIGSYINVSSLILILFGIHFLIELTLMEKNWLQRTMPRRAAFALILFIPIMFSVTSSFLTFTVFA
jgi:hypothetical protein